MTSTPTPMSGPPRTVEDLQDLAQAVASAVTLAASDAEANVTVTRTRHGLTRFANSFVHQHVGEDTTVVALTLALDGRTASAATTDTDPAAVDALVRRTLTSARVQPVDPTWPGATPAADVPTTGNLDPATVDATPQDRVDVVRRFVDADPTLLAAGFVDTATTDAAFASTAGQRVAATATRATVDGIHQTPTSAGSGHATSFRLRDLDGAAVGATAADLARRSATAVDLDPGTYEVVLLPEAVATVVTFLAYYGFNGKAHAEGASFVRLGEAQLDRAITLTAAPDDPRAVGLPFDAEGSLRQRYHLVEDGVSRQLSHDRRTARAAGTETTGDALPGGEGFGSMPATMVLRPGDTSPEQMVARLDRGLLVTSFNYCRVLDPKTMVVTGLTRNGTFLVEDGRIVGAVGNLRFTQSFLDALGDGRVAAVGDDDRYAAGEFGEGMTIVPSLQLASWSFTGGARG